MSLVMPLRILMIRLPKQRQRALAFHAVLKQSELNASALKQFRVAVHRKK